MEMKQNIQELERQNTGTAWTLNDEFEKNGYFVIKDLWDPNELKCELPNQSGQLTYWGKEENEYTKKDVEMQVQGSLSRYWYPQYRVIHYGIKNILEKKISRKLYPTYYYDRFYFPGQELSPHVDRDACEISVSVHIGTNITGECSKWPFWIKTPDTYFDKKKEGIILHGKNKCVILSPGDGVVYKGAERPHWRESLKVEKNKKGLYYHQIFFHYVLQDGQRAHCAWDRAR